MKITKISVTWKITWPGPVNYSTLSPQITVERTLEEGERYEDAVMETNDLAIRSTMDCLLEGLSKIDDVIK